MTWGSLSATKYKYWLYSYYDIGSLCLGADINDSNDDEEYDKWYKQWQDDAEDDFNFDWHASDFVNCPGEAPSATLDNALQKFLFFLKLILFLPFD